MPAVFAVTQNIGCSPAAVIRKGFSMQEKYDNNTTPTTSAELDPDFRPFTDDFIFSLVMRDPALCRELLALALPEEDFGEIKIMKSQNPLIDEPADDAAEAAHTETQPDSAHSDTRALTVETQKSLKFVKDMHGVRFDAYIKSENVWAEVEMQTVSNLPLGKRARYYQSNMDLDCLEKGADYTALKKCYVIFICTFDYFKKDAPVYFFRSWDVEKGLPLDDFSYKIVLNAACSPDKVPEKLKPLYAYLNDPRQSQVSPLTRMIDARVKKFNTDEWRRKYMTFEYMLKERERKGIEQGRAEGHAAGLSEGRSEGLVEGAAQEKRAIAKNFKHAGIPVDVIAENTGLTAEEIENL